MRLLLLAQFCAARWLAGRLRDSNSRTVGFSPRAPQALQSRSASVSRLQPTRSAHLISPASVQRVETCTKSVRLHMVQMNLRTVDAGHVSQRHSKTSGGTFSTSPLHFVRVIVPTPYVPAMRPACSSACQQLEFRRATALYNDKAEPAVVEILPQRTSHASVLQCVTAGCSKASNALQWSRVNL